MKFLNKMADACFDKQADGSNIFWKYGILGNKGYVITSDELYYQLRNFILRFHMYCLPAIVTAFVISNYYYQAYFLLPIPIVFYEIWLFRILRRLPKSKKQAVSLKERASSYSWQKLRLLSASSVIFTVFGIGMFISGLNSSNWKYIVCGAIGVLFFAAGSVVWIQALRSKNTEREDAFN